MTRQDLFELTRKLYESSITMREINDDLADLLLQMSTQTLALLEQVNLPEDIRKEVDDITAEILSDG